MINSYFDYIEIIPADALDTCGKEEKEYNPFYGQVSDKIGITNYIISVSCEGKEAIQEKIKRLIFDCRQPSEALMFPCAKKKKIAHDNSRER